MVDVLDAGVYFLSGGHDRKINLFNTASGALVTAFEGHAWEVYDVCISHDGSNFLSGGGDRAVFLWDASARRIVRRFTGHFQRINAVGFGGDSSVAASASYDQSVRLWDIRSSSRFPLMVLEEAKDSVSSLHLHGPEILTGSVDGHLRCYDIRNGRLRTDNVQHPVTSVRFTDDRLALLSASLDSHIRLFDAESGVLLNEYGQCVRARASDPQLHWPRQHKVPHKRRAASWRRADRRGERRRHRLRVGRSQSKPSPCHRRAICRAPSSNPSQDISSR